MPCYDPRAGATSNLMSAKTEINKMSDLICEQKEYTDKLEAMLCAMCNEADDDTIELAMENGKCPPIVEWFVDHRNYDAARIEAEKIPYYKLSVHEQKLVDYYKKIKEKL